MATFKEPQIFRLHPLVCECAIPRLLACLSSGILQFARRFTRSIPFSLNMLYLNNNCYKKENPAPVKSTTSLVTANLW
jgi:hypothetical protein